MLPSENDIAKFMSFAPGASEGQALMLLEGADTINEAINQFYEQPDTYSHNPVSRMIDTVDPTEEANMQADAPPSYASLVNVVSEPQYPPHTNAVIEAAKVRARDEQKMQNMLQSVQLRNRIYNSDIEPEHESDLGCDCYIHRYRIRKMDRLDVQEMWSKAVMYPGEKAYHDLYQSILFSNNPYSRVMSPYGPNGAACYGAQAPQPHFYTMWLQQTIKLNASLNVQAQAAVDAREPPFNIWDMNEVNLLIPETTVGAISSDRTDDRRRHSIAGSLTNSIADGAKSSKFKALKRAFSIKSAEEKFSLRGQELRNAILEEESGRWPDQESRQIVAAYQENIGMTQKIAHLRAHCPIQYLHLLRAGYFEPIPVAWANLDSNPLKFTIDSSAGWRGITPAWRGFENTAEERLYWVLNHREGSGGMRIKPDSISTMEMARARMASAVEPPPIYYSANDTCQIQHTSEGYSRQVMPTPFRATDEPEGSKDYTVILLDVSGSMEMNAFRPIYDQYLITGYCRSPQPINKDVSKSIIRRFTDAMANHDHNFEGYQLVTFSSQAQFIGFINHSNFDVMWDSIRFGGRTRIMTGWQRVKDLHFQRHSASATFHPVYGWQAGPETPMLRLLLLLDGEAMDMDEFELDLLSLSWVHVTIFLIGVDGCPHHHRHANELQRISEINPHVSFVDAQGNTPERFVTHELLKRHLGYDLSLAEFEELEQQPPSYE